MERLEGEPEDMNDTPVNRTNREYCAWTLKVLIGNDGVMDIRKQYRW